MSEAEQMLIAAVARGRNDFAYFCEFLCGVRPHPGQIDVTDNLDDHLFAVLALPNGWGKTVYLALLLLWASFYRKWAVPGWGVYRVYGVGPQMKHAILIHAQIEAIRLNRSRVQFWCKHVRCPLGAECPDAKPHKFLLAQFLSPFRDESQHEAFRWSHNGSLIFFKSAEGKAEALEGLDPYLIVYDEARRELHLDFVVNEVILPRGNRVPGMRMVLSSTPLMDSFDFMEFFKKGERGEANWYARRGSIDENIYLDAEQLQRIIDALDPRVVAQVMRGEMVAPPDAYFVSEAVLDCMDDATGPEPNITEFRGKAIPGHVYAGGIDSAVSEGGDEAVCTVWDITQIPFRVIFERVFPKGTRSSDLKAQTDVILQAFGLCQMAYDANGQIGVEFKNAPSPFDAYYVPVHFAGGAKVIPAVDVSSKPTPGTKAEALATFRHFVNTKQWRCPNIPALRAQILGYKIKDAHLKTDRLMAQVMAAMVARNFLPSHIREGFFFNDFQSMYSGTNSPFVSLETEFRSGSQRKWMRLVEMDKARHEQPATSP